MMDVTGEMTTEVTSDDMTTEEGMTMMTDYDDDVTDMISEEGEVVVIPVDKKTFKALGFLGYFRELLVMRFGLSGRKM